MGPAIGGAQGKLAQSSISTALSYGVKYKTGKYPIQHILKQKKEKVVKTVSLMEEKALTTTNKIKHNLVKKPELRLVKANYKIIKAKITKLKIRTISKKIFIHEPRFSYLARWKKSKKLTFISNGIIFLIISIQPEVSYS